MKLHQLSSLIAVAENGSIHKAARSLNLTQPAVSKALADLETEIGAPLFVRSPKGAHLTLYGHSLIRHAQVIQQEMRHAREDITALLGTPKGVLTIGVTPVTVMGPFGEALKAFVVSHPQVSVGVIELRPSQIRDGLDDGSIDFGILTGIDTPPNERFYRENLFSVPTIVAARKQHPARGPQSLRSLVENPWLVLDILQDTTSTIGAVFSQYQLDQPKNILRCTSTALYVEMMMSFDYVCLLSETGLETTVLKGLLRKLSVREKLPAMSIGLIARDSNLGTVGTSFIKLLRTFCRASTGYHLRKNSRVEHIRD